MLHCALRTHAGHFVLAMAIGLGLASTAAAEIPGLTGNSFQFAAKADRITTPDGNSILIWGLSTLTGRAQYPSPTLIVNQSDTVTITVSNQLPPSAGQRVSLTFPGQEGVTAECLAAPCAQGPLALEAGWGGSVKYQFKAVRPGTFLYTSASQPDLQIEMGMVGAIIVRPTGYADAPAASRRAYGAPDSWYDREYLFLLSEMDSHIHDLVEQQGPAAVYKTTLLADYFPNYWFINGRNAPDTMADSTEAGKSRFPTQPYNALPKMHPGERLLMRVIGGGRDPHPFHHHGNHARVIAVDGHPLASVGGAAFDLSHEVFTIQSVPGQTVDAVFTWTAKDLGWDIYGDDATHDAVFAPLNLTRPSCDPGVQLDAEGLDPVTKEYCADHGKKIPVVLPDFLSTDFGGFWSGSPYLGVLALLPPGQGGLNPDAGYTYMWHSHTEKEITNFDIFPGGMMTMLIIVPRGTAIQPAP